VWNHVQLVIKQAGFVANPLAFDTSTFFTLSGRGVRQGPYSRHLYLRFEVVDRSTFTFSEDVKCIQRAFAPARSFNIIRNVFHLQKIPLPYLLL
jgi:hypothetical protein